MITREMHKVDWVNGSLGKEQWQRKKEKADSELYQSVDTKEGKKDLHQLG